MALQLLRCYTLVHKFALCKYHFPIIPKPVEMILPWSKAISHKNSQNSTIPGIPKGVRMSKYHFPIIPKPVEVILPWCKAISPRIPKIPDMHGGTGCAGMSKYHFPIIPKPMEVILPYSKDVSHDNSQNSRISKGE